MEAGPVTLQGPISPPRQVFPHHACFVKMLNASRPFVSWRELRHPGRVTVCMASNGNVGVVITGGSKGLGFHLAKEFLLKGDEVLVCGRDEARLDAAYEALRRESGGRIHAVLADVSRPGDMEKLEAETRKRLPNLCFWINNAGSVTSKRLLADVDPMDICSAVGANVLRSLLGSRAAIRIMRDQIQSQVSTPDKVGRGMFHRHILNLGFSSWGANLSKTAVTHKMTKRSLSQLTISLADELKNSNLPIGVHNLSPGLVLTDLLLRDSTPIARRFFNTLADEPEVIANALVPKIRSVTGTQTSIEYLSPSSAFTRVVSGLPSILNGGRFFDKEGNRVVGTGDERFKANGVRVPYEIEDLEMY